jgi:hypothetical protein
MKKRTWVISAGALLLAGMISLPAAAITGPGMVELLNLSGARQAAMGETAPLFDSDPFNLEYNPAALSSLSKGRVAFSYQRLIQDRTDNALAIAFPLQKMDFGVVVRLSSIGDIEGRGDVPSSDPLYTFSSYDFAVKTYASLKLTTHLQAGLSAGWLMEKIDQYRGSSGAAGVGLLYRLDNGLIFHGSAANLGPKYSMNSVKQDIPATYRLGASFHRNEATVSADYVNVKSGDSHIHLGAEYLVQQMLYVRAGYQSGYDSRSFSAGAGFIYKNIRIDYAFVPYKYDLGTTHRFTATYAIR